MCVFDFGFVALLALTRAWYCWYPDVARPPRAFRPAAAHTESIRGIHFHLRNPIWDCGCHIKCKVGWFVDSKCGLDARRCAASPFVRQIESTHIKTKALVVIRKCVHCTFLYQNAPIGCRGRAGGRRARAGPSGRRAVFLKNKKDVRSARAISPLSYRF